MTPRKLFATATALALLGAGPAYAHGDIQASDPAVDARVGRSPGSVAITFTEAPTAQAILKVRDGCKRNVTDGVSVTDATATVGIAGGEPGAWKVSYRVISSLDGHRTQGSYAFTVAGKKDCTPDEPTAPPESDDPEPEEDGALPDGDEEPGSSAPLIPIALGAVALVALALIVRRSGS